MVRPGCVGHGLPQAQRIAQTIRAQVVTVIGLHCVFEHHAAMTPVSLRAFLHEYRIRFPVAVDMAGGNDPPPQTMAACALGRKADASADRPQGAAQGAAFRAGL